MILNMMKDEDDLLRYDKMVENALRGVVRRSIEDVVEHGLPEEHHFYITFITDFPGVQIPDYLRERYPGEMTIVLQYQFSDLFVDDIKMGVTLSFNNIPEKLEVPLAAISIFADPSVNFALQFQPMDGGEADELLNALEESDFDPDDGGDDPSGGGKDSETGEVISLDNFRNK